MLTNNARAGLRKLVAESQEPVLVTTELAELYSGRGRETLYRWASEGRITRFGGRSHGSARWDLRQIPGFIPGERLPPPPPLTNENE